jgi:hypothetical protein
LLGQMLLDQAQVVALLRAALALLTPTVQTNQTEGRRVSNGDEAKRLSSLTPSLCFVSACPQCLTMP